jgi:spermidine synthase
VSSQRTQTIPSRPGASPLSPTARNALLFWTASTLFFLSGGTGLAYQVVWFKRFSHALGSSSFAMAAVVASFLTGLGLGAHLIGRISDRVRWPLFWYGVSEAAIGVIALLIPLEIMGLFKVSSIIYPLLEGKVALQAISWFILTFIILAPPCILMGGTLPLLIKQFTPPDGTPRESTGWLYAINTLGAATGCYLAGFHLLPTLGLRWTNVAVACLNLAIGAVAISLQWTAMRRASSAPPPAPSRQALEAAYGGRQGPTLGVLYVTVALTGCAALILEMVWTRQLALILGGSTYAFTAMLFLLLVGIGLGSMAFHLWFRKSPNASVAAVLVIAGLALSTLIGKLLIPDLSAGVGLLKMLRKTQTGNAAICVAASAVLELLPAIGMGLLFPLFVDLTRKRAADAGKAIGSIYAWNTLGSIAGATLTSLVLIPGMGTSKTVALALGMYTAALVLLFPFPRHQLDLAKLFAIFAIMVGVAYVASDAPDPRRTNLGFFMYGYDGQEEKQYKTAYFKEGSSCNVYVARQGAHNHTSLRVNGKVDASSSGDMNTQLGSAYFPIFLHPDAREILVIGFGSGTTSGASLLFPHTNVTCCEIEPAVYKASEFFAAVNHKPQDNLRRFKVVFDDGRSHLQGTSKKFDMIISEPSNPWIAGVSNLFTKEFYEEAKEKLTPTGILTQWIQLYSFSAEDYALVVRTVMQVFPHCGLIRISDGDTLLLASMTPFATSREPIDKAQALVDGLPKIKEDLEKYFGSSDVRSLLFRHLLLDEKGLARLLEMDSSSGINTDLNLTLEFDAPIRLFAPSDSREDMKAHILAAVSPAWFTKLAETWGFTKKQAAAFHELSGLFDRTQHRETVLGLLELGLSLDPDDISLLTAKLILSRSLDDESFHRLSKRLMEASNKEANRLGVTLFKDGQTARAVAVFEGLVALYPESVSSWNNLAVAYDGLAKLDEAEKAFQKALSLDPLSETTKNSYQNFTQKRSRKGIGPPGPPASEMSPPVAEATDESPPATADQGPAVGPPLPGGSPQSPAGSSTDPAKSAAEAPKASEGSATKAAPEGGAPPGDSR